ncbi:PLP-dependent aminotransferase family protein [Candidatus Methylospira mobilis]|uniref:MocR-like pyridoxine biosynthesis transcription factor PdxR n=1 Tax=Candidatus Methylospira mobilis TaxID=1808979 RepID=UPI001D172B14|nr:PLP-dependent aminotransferase family protein [Candidatus Methylospira mobilis]WNV05091.1 PLP-dependent aminotransferase family protein [Candidatus Methylospira mobilis]
MTISRKDGLPVHLQIAQQIVDEIKRGRLAPGTVLPGSRAIADELGLNRKTVVLAFDELTAQGWLRSQGGKGTFVAPDIPSTALQANEEAVCPPHGGLLPPTYRLTDLPSTWDEPAPHGSIMFSDGVPDSRLIPFEILGRAYRRALITAARANRLAYGDPRGETALRQALADMLRAERKLPVGADNVCIVRGSQMGIYVAARLLISPGDHVAVDTLSYPPARAAFQAAGAQIHGITMDAFGMSPDALESLCRKHQVAAIYLTPHHQFPTTRLMPVERRMQLFLLAEKYGFAIVEDDYDHEFHFSNRPMFPLASLDQTGKVIYIGSLSKVVAPGLRVGYVAGHKTVIDRCASEIMIIDRQGNAVTELAVAELLENGELRRHIRRALRIYQERRSQIAEQVSIHLGNWADFDLPDGGLALWLRLKEKVDVERVITEARTNRVIIPSSRHFAHDGRPAPGLRLGFGSLTPDEIAAGVKQLRYAFEKTALRISGKK